MRVFAALLIVLLASCTACPRPTIGLGTPRVADRARGIPKPIVEDSVALLEQEHIRHCQVLFEPAFGSPHAVWFVQGGAAADVTVHVRLRTKDQMKSYSAPLDRSTAWRLSALCWASLTLRDEACERLGYDGVWYHAAHPLTAHSYAMASFWSPRRGTMAHDFVKLAEALRNYATTPEGVRLPAWIALREAAAALSERLAMPASGVAEQG